MLQRRDYRPRTPTSLGGQHAGHAPGLDGRRSRLPDVSGQEGRRSGAEEARGLGEDDVRVTLCRRRPGWQALPLSLLRAERDARLARVGHLAKSKDVKRHKYSWVQSTQRLPDVKVKPEGAHVAGKLAAADANGVADELAETEVFRPVRM